MHNVLATSLVICQGLVAAAAVNETGGLAPSEAVGNNGGKQKGGNRPAWHTFAANLLEMVDHLIAATVNKQFLPRPSNALTT